MRGEVASPAKTPVAAMASATAAETVHARVFMWAPPLVSGRLLHALGGELEEVSVGERELRHEAEVLRAIARRERDDGDRLAVTFEHRLRQARLARHADRDALEMPLVDFAGRVLHVEPDVDVWVDPVHFRHHPVQRNGLVDVELTCYGVVGNGGAHEQDAYEDSSNHSSHWSSP